ncbi:MAG TPA: aminoacyl-tRNA hydrolase [Candidatus Saccharimonadales bacterium]|nr:aminoacyl-tRNA hydrolase [Candidatus Saccharimonadales bacterium]
MKLIVGLGNPGEKYEKTRHNLGFMTLEKFLKDFASVEQTVWENNKKFKSDIAEFDWQSKNTGTTTKIILAKPKTYMNNSGMAVSLLANYYKITPEDIWVLCDDIDLQLGFLRIRFGGGTAGHRGTESILEHLNTDKFWRFRMGIGRPGHMKDGEYFTEVKKDIDDYVLGTFSGQEWGKIRELITRTTDALETALEENLETAMHKFNTK